MTNRIVLNALALRPGGSGVQTYIRELVRELPAATNAQLAVLLQEDAVEEVPSALTRIVRPRADGVRRAWHGIRPVGSCSLVHGLNSALPLVHDAAKVITVHDLAYFDAPWASSRRHAAAARLQVRTSVWRADAIIAVSAFTAERVREHFGREAVSIPLAASPSMRPPTDEAVTKIRARYDLPGQFVLHVGTIEPRKDVATLVAACGKARLPLVLAGARAAGIAAPSRAIELGYVPTEALPALYGAATIVAYTSRYEGFGLPPLEACACGAPLVASSIPPLRETLEGAAELVRPGRIDELAEVLDELAHDDSRRHDLARRGLERAQGCSWVTTARRTAEVYRSLVSGA